MTAREVLSDKSKWTKSCIARTNEGEQCEPTSKMAVAWCAIGAIEKAYSTSREESKTAMAKLRQVIIANYHHSFIDNFNDDPDITYEDVIMMMEEAGI